MKKLFFVLLVIMASCTPKEEKTIITGEIENHDAKTIELIYPKDYITHEYEEHEIILDENYNFSIELAIDRDIIAYLGINRRNYIELFLEPGDELNISTDVEDIKGNLVFSGKKADNSELLNEYFATLEDQYSQFHVYEKIRNSNTVEFIEFADQMLENKKTLFDELSADKNLSDSFEHYIKTEIQFDYYEKLLNYPENHKRLNQLEEAPELPEGYFDFTDNALKNLSDKNLISNGYRTFLTSYIDHYIYQNPDKIPEDKSNTETAINLAEKLYDGKTSNYVKAYYINSEFVFGSFEVAENYYKSFLENDPEKEYIEVLTSTYETIKSLLPGEPAPGFELTDIDGNKVSLEDFRGNVVYLDFWAGWCSPCISEIPYAKELKKRFKDDDDLVFVYISVDDDSESWKKAVEKHGITGVHLHAEGFNNEVARSYNVKGIPSYFIIDRNGLIFDNRAKRPSNENVDEDLRKALETIS